MVDLEKIAERLSNLTVLEAAELSKRLKEKWGSGADGAGVQVDYGTGSVVLANVANAAAINANDFIFA
jgi:ribosomal protein L7/L12